MKTRVLIVDDSSVIRRLLNDTLREDPGIEVVGSAADGESALEKLESCKPDVITLDVEMPGMGGLDLLVEIRKRNARIPVIMFSSLTERAAVSTLEALARGATDYATKPSGAGSLTAAIEQVRAQLIPKIKGLAPRAPGAVARVARIKRVEPMISPPRILAIGASTGGPNALAALLAALPRDFSVPIVITQHMPPLFTQFLAERLRLVSGLDCREASDGDAIVPGRVLVAPGDRHMLLREGGDLGRVRLDDGPPENSCRPSVDVMFRSVAKVYGASALAVVLTGMGQDGLRGCEKLSATGARILVQDEASSVVWGMPGIVAREGLAELEADIAGLAAAITDRCRMMESKHAG